MNRKETEQAIRAELERHPNISYQFSQGGKHPCVVLACGGKTRRVFYSSTPTERRAVLNQRTFIRRTIRELAGG